MHCVSSETSQQRCVHKSLFFPKRKLQIFIKSNGYSKSTQTTKVFENAGHAFHFMYCYRFITRDWIIHKLKCKNWRQEGKNWHWHVNIAESISNIKMNTQQHFPLHLAVFFCSSWTYSNVWTGSALVIYDVPLITDAGRQKQHLIPWWLLVHKWIQKWVFVTLFENAAVLWLH